MNAASHIWAGEETETPWRFRLQEMAWRDLVDALKHDDLPFVGLWCDGTDVHALFLPDGQPLGNRHPAVLDVFLTVNLREGFRQLFSDFCLRFPID